MKSITHQQKCSCHDCIEPSKTPFIDPKTLLARLPLDNNSSKPYKHLTFTKSLVSPTSHLSLQGLPIEIYGEILSYLTVQEVTDLRRVSQFTRRSIDGILQYQEIHTYAPSALRACLATCTASRITLRQLYYALTNPECSLCGAELGTNLFLFTGQRICIFCLRNDITLQPIEVKSVLKFACSAKSKARQLLPLSNTIKAVPGEYATTGGGGSLSAPSARKALFLESDVPLAKKALLNETEAKMLFGSPNSHDADVRRDVKHNPLLHPSTESDIDPQDPNRTRNGPLIPVTNTTLSLSLLYMTSIFVPFLHPRTKMLDPGVMCRKCVLRMMYMEAQWIEEQNQRWIMGRTSTASERRRGVINEARRKSCVFFTRETLRVHVEEHHQGVKISEEERKFIKRMKDLGEGGDGMTVGELDF